MFALSHTVWIWFARADSALLVPIVCECLLRSIYGLLTFFIGVGGAIGPVLGGVIYDHFGSYRYLWLINIFVLSCIALAILTLKKGKQYTTTGS